MRSLIAFITVIFIVSGCAPPNKVAVIERVTVDRNVEIDRIGGNLVRHVQPGDTLYSISFEMGLNVNDIAAWNQITDTAQLRLGRRIRLTKPIGFVEKPTSENETANAKKIRPVTKEPNIAKPHILPKQDNSLDSQTPVSQQATSQRARRQTVFEKNITTWSWPLKGNIVRRFSQAKGQQGIDIQGQTGQAVVSANAGEVVYVGNSLKGYGNLVIIKHNDVFLSAYAHNSEIYVRESERITAQQRIGSVGLNRNNETAVHFQIRKNGQPVNPLLYLSLND